jgi:hypothetical protein
MTSLEIVVVANSEAEEKANVSITGTVAPHKAEADMDLPAMVQRLV